MSVLANKRLKMDVIFATNNGHKIKEMQELLCSCRVVPQSDIGFNDIVIEDGVTFEENAIKKVESLRNFILASPDKCDVSHKNTSKVVYIAEDSGLEVDFLDGAPGVRTARYASVHSGKHSDDENMNKLLRKLEGVRFADRGAKFVCVIALAWLHMPVMLFRGELCGKILSEPIGSGGFGYDPIFYAERYDCSMAELDSHCKNLISHRARAVFELRQVLDCMLKGERCEKG